MKELLRQWNFPLLRVLSFIWRVVRRFFGRSRGFLLAGAVAYNALLSLIPLFIILLIGLSLFFDTELLLEAVSTELSLIVPGQGERIMGVIATFVEERELVGSVGFLVVIFFSSIAFRILEEAFSVIFEHHHDKADRHFWVSALIPYVYIGVVGLSLVALTVVTGFIDAFDGTRFVILGYAWQVTSIGPWLMRLLGLLGLILLFSSIYMVMPTARIQIKRAVFGGTIAALLWEGVRTFLVWYFDNLSLVNVVYGSLATVIIVLLSMEIATIIILLGAQSIAEVERAERAGIPWWADPDTYEAAEGDPSEDQDQAGGDEAASSSPSSVADDPSLGPVEPDDGDLAAQSSDPEESVA